MRIRRFSGVIAINFSSEIIRANDHHRPFRYPRAHAHRISTATRDSSHSRSAHAHIRCHFGARTTYSRESNRPVREVTLKSCEFSSPHTKPRTSLPHSEVDNGNKTQDTFGRNRPVDT